jgi:excisionase family DNA binding protein
MSGALGPRERLVSAEAVAELLGVQPAWVLEQARAGGLPSYKLGHYRRFRLSEVEAWLQARAAGHYKRRTAMTAEHGRP